MLKALADLPVDLGIEAIDKFTMASLDSIRSKTGFMVSLPAWETISVSVPDPQTRGLPLGDGPKYVLLCADGDHQAYSGRPVRTVQGPLSPRQVGGTAAAGSRQQGPAHVLACVQGTLCTDFITLPSVLLQAPSLIWFMACP